MSDTVIISALSGIIGTLSGVIVSHTLNKSGKVRLLPEQIHIHCSQIQKNILTNSNFVGLFHLNVTLNICIYNGKNHTISADHFMIILNYNNTKIKIQCACKDFYNIPPYSTHYGTIIFRKNFESDLPNIESSLEKSVIKFYGNGFIKGKTKLNSDIYVLA